jgi:hypothetical protein
MMILLCAIDQVLFYVYFSIQKQHAAITVKNGEITIKPAAQGAKTKVNGMPLPGERVLKHLDRVLFGKYNTLEKIFNHACLLKQ